MQKKNVYLITGGAGFIGANFLKYMLDYYKNDEYIVLDKLTYAGNIGTIIADIEKHNVHFIRGDICDETLVDEIFIKYKPNYVVNFAAESHVDRSIENPKLFLETNILGVQTLLSRARKFWSLGKDDKGYDVYPDNVKYLQVSTDEVYGALSREYIDGKYTSEFGTIYGEEFFEETTSLKPRSPYSASKASADMLCDAYFETYHLPLVITRCSNNYGPYHFPEKLIPLTIMKALQGKSIPVYGDGKQVRDWLYVEDHCSAIDKVLHAGIVGEKYNVGGHNEARNIDIVKLIIATLRELLENRPELKKHSAIDLHQLNDNLIIYVEDRLGHDVRYAINPRKIKIDLDWTPKTDFSTGIKKTVEWVLSNQEWVNSVISTEYESFYDLYYSSKEK